VKFLFSFGPQKLLAKLFPRDLFFTFIILTALFLTADESILRHFNSSQYLKALEEIDQELSVRPEKILKKEMLYNLSLASWQLGLTQNAAAYLHEAKKLYPLDPAVGELYRFYQQDRPQVMAHLPRPFPPWPLNWSAFVFAFSLLGWAILSSIQSGSKRFNSSKKNLFFKRSIVGAGLFSLLSGSITGYQLSSQWAWQTLVTEAASALKTRPDDAAPDLQQLSEGQRLKVLEVNEGPSAKASWARVELISGLRGWIPASHLYVLYKHPILFESSPRQRWLSFFQNIPYLSSKSEDSITGEYQ
jgi:tetratricopeptide (TPR) repeat protein